MLSLKWLKYIAILMAGAGVAVIGMLLLGYERVQEKDPVRLIKPVAMNNPPLIVKDSSQSEELLKANKKLDKKLDRLADSLSSLKAKFDSLKPLGTNDSISPSHSLKLDSLQIAGEDIVIERDQLLSSEVMKVRALKKQNPKVKSDSLVDSLRAGLNIQPQVEPEYVEIEFWKSPLNYRGYKLSKSKIVIYGLMDELVLDVTTDGEALFLKTNKATYRLQKTAVLKDLQAVAQ